MESFLSALDLAGGAAQPRAITIATSPSSARWSSRRLRTRSNRVSPDPVTQHRHYRCQQSADQRQVDLLIDSDTYSQAIAHHLLFEDRLVMYCREGHPALPMPLTEENLRQYEFALKLPPGQRYPAIYRQRQEPRENAAAASAATTCLPRRR
jgi:DNA-binding transcriptional LysR family regulator